MPSQYTPLPNSTYLDYDSYRSDAPSPTGAGAIGNFTFNVALVLDRANDPTALLNADWGSRQQQLESLTDSGALWSTYGANPAVYNQVLATLSGLGIHTVNQVDPANGYVSSAESRTIWVQVDQSNFATLFGTPLVAGHDQAGNTVAYWQGDLSLPQPLAALGVKGPVVRHRPVRHGAGAVGRGSGGGAATGGARHRQQHAARRCHPRPAGHRPELLQFSAIGGAVGSVVRPRRQHRHDRPARAQDRQRAGAGCAGGRIRGAARRLSPGDGHRHGGPGDNRCARWAAGDIGRRRTLARCRRGDGDQPAEPARPLCRFPASAAMPTPTPTPPTRPRFGTR